MKENFINVGAHMPIDLERRARILAARLGISRSEFLRLALEHFVLIKEIELNETWMKKEQTIINQKQ